VVTLAALFVGEAHAANATEWRGLNGKRVEITCEPEFELGSVWGTDVYTDDTDVCTAAAHAGAITRVSGGVVVIEIRPGQDHYAGSKRNDIESGTFPEWSGSFVIVSGEPRGRRDRRPRPPDDGRPVQSPSVRFNPPALLGPTDDDAAVGFATVEPGVNLTWALDEEERRLYNLRSYVEIEAWDPLRGDWMPQIATFTEGDVYTLEAPYLVPETWYAWRVTAVASTPSGPQRATTDWSLFQTGTPGLATR
jgi:hypothetical protein